MEDGGAVPAGAANLVFAVNGERFQLSTIDPSTTLLQFLRSKTRFKSVKLGCGEGGCGACIVLLSKYDPVSDEVENFTVSSCLTLLCSIDRCSITTSEGLGNTKDGFHTIHQRFVGFHASQCGFCTPGMCMSLFSALTNAEKTQRAEPPPGFSKLTVSEAEKAIVGNLCRCTGYRSIADACKSFAADVDMEDLGFNSFWKKGDSKKVKVTKLPFYNPSNQVSTFPEFLKNEFRSSMPFISRKNSWYNPTSVKELTSMLKSTLTESGARVKLVVGNTGSGYCKEIGHYDKYIDLRYIPDLSMIRRDQTGIEIGAAVTISKAISVLKEENKSEFLSHGEVVFQKIADHMERIASGFIRNSASIGGNLVMAQRNHFPSDIATILLAVGSEVNVITDFKHEKVTLEEFLGRPPLDSTSVLMSVHIPCWEPARNATLKTDARLVFETYRAAPRPLGNALPYLNAAFLAEVTPCKTSSGVIIGNIQLTLGAYGSKHAIRARKVEEFLVGKLLNVGVLYEAIKLLGATVVPEVGTSNAAYRSSLAVNFLFQFLCPFVDACDEFCDVLLHGCNDAFLLRASETSNNQKQFDHKKNPVLPLSAKQVVELNQNYSPVGEPITKAGSAIQASGEAVYVDDIPSPTNCLHGAFIYSTKPLAWVKRVKLNSKYLQDSVAGIISFRDIPKGGENIGSKTIFGIEPLFADDITRCAGQALAFVVADTQKLADMAAENAWVDYDTGNLEPPILTVEEAVERSSFIEVPPFLYPAQIGDFSRGMNEADQKILSAEIKLGSQYHFYMETQSALAIPDEDNCMLVYSASQCPEFVHSTIARCLGVPEHNVCVVTRRVGGAFGGKATRSMHLRIQLHDNLKFT